VSKFPPDNDIIIMCQSIFNTTVMHEVGHSLNLYHTHQGQNSSCTNPCPPACVPGNDDGCADTLPDASCYDQNDIALYSYGQTYANLTAGQKYNVDMVWSNLMSYHNGDYRSMISPCQLDRMSTQASSDQTWLLSKRPVYVDPGNAGAQDGTFPHPYQTIQNAINASALNNRVLVLDVGTHDNPSSAISTATDVVPRKGSATIRDHKLPYDLPITLEDSPNPAVRQAILRAQAADRQKDIQGVITNLLEAEKHARGRERDAIRLELAQRYRDNNQLEEAAAWFDKAAAEADQPGLKKRAGEKGKIVRDEVERRKREQNNPPADAGTGDAAQPQGRP